MDKTQTILENEGFCTKEQFKMFCKMVEKIKNNGEEVIGWHGTRAKIAKKIEKEGFKNFRCKEGGYGVYFSDENYRDNAREIAIEKCKEKNEINYAIIKAIVRHPNPDLLMGRPQFLAQAENTKIIRIEYFKLNNQ